MKIKDGLNLDILLEYGFEKINKEELDDEDYIISLYDYQFEIGHSRRGQVYSLLCNEKTRKLSIYASEPDGGGGSVACPDILIKLILDGIITETQQ